MHVCAWYQECGAEQVCFLAAPWRTSLSYLLSFFHSFILSLGLLVGTIVTLVALIVKRNEAPINFYLLFAFVSHTAHGSL